MKKPILAILTALSLLACKKETTTTPAPATEIYDGINGNWNNINGSETLFITDSTKLRWTENNSSTTIFVSITGSMILQNGYSVNERYYRINNDSEDTLIMTKYLNMVQQWERIYIR